MDSTNHNNRTPIPPKELHGKLVAWNSAHTRIIASGDTYGDVKRAALVAGETDPVFEQLPAADEGFVGTL